MRKILLLLLLFITVNYARAEKYGAYGLILKDVTITVNEKDEKTVSNVINDELKGSKFPVSASSFQDSVLNISFVSNPTHISIKVSNISSNSFNIIWDDCEFITYTGKIHKIIHSGVKMINRGEPMISTKVRKGTAVSDVLIAVDNVSYSDYFKRWMYKYMLAGKEESNDYDFKIAVTIRNAGNDEIRYIFNFKTIYYGGKNTTYFDGDDLVWYKIIE